MVDIRLPGFPRRPRVVPGGQPACLIPERLRVRVVIVRRPRNFPSRLENPHRFAHGMRGRPARRHRNDIASGGLIRIRRHGKAERPASARARRGKREPALGFRRRPGGVGGDLKGIRVRFLPKVP